MRFPASFDACSLKPATVTAQSESEVPLNGDSVLPTGIPLLTMLSTYVQSFEPSFQGSTKSGLVETGFSHSLRSVTVQTRDQQILYSTDFLAFKF